MSLSSLSIRRPVLAMVMSIVIILFGVIGFTYLGVREYPVTDPPIINVVTSYVGANADIVESQITEPLEESINGIAGIRTLTSVSREGRSTITVEFELDIDLEAAANDVRDRVSRVLGNLPPDIENPVVSKSDADSRPIVFLNVRSDSRDVLAISDIANNVFKERLQTIPGVSAVQIWGEKKYAMRLWIDPFKLTAYSLTPVDIINALQRENVELPSGRIEGDVTELTVRTMGRLNSLNDFNNLILKDDGVSLVRFKDVGYAILGPENERTVLKRDGVPMVGVVLIPQPGANNIAIADEFYRRVELIKRDLPEDIGLGVGFDVTEYIRESILEVQQTVFIAFGLVVLIIFMFLRDWRTTIIPTVVIPIALVGAFFIMYVFGFSINVLTMLAIVLAIGLVVDDAIVVVENIYAKIEDEMEPEAAALKGSEEIFFAIISTTVALAAVFLPVLFLEGLVGRLFREFAIVISGSVIISSFVALTLSPMLSAKILKKRAVQPWIYRVTEPFFASLTDAYERTLRRFLEKRWLALPIILFCIVTIFIFNGIIPAELAPLEDRNQIRLFATAPEGSTFEFMDNYMTDLLGFVADEVPEADAIITVTSPGFGAASSVNTGFTRLILVNPELRGRTQQAIADKLTVDVRQLSGARTYVSQEPTIGDARAGLPVQYVIQAPNLDKLKEILPIFIDEANKRPEFAFTDVNLKFNKPELQITIDRERARTLGVSTLDIARTLQLAYSGQRFGYFIMNGKQYQVIGQVQRENRDEPLDLRTLSVKNSRGQLIQMDNLVSISEESSPPALFRFDRYSSATISAGLAPGFTIGQGIEAMDEVAKKVLDDTYSTTLSGPSRDFTESASSLDFALILAIVLIYLILAAQFESFRDPLIILFTVPLAFSGALFSLWYFNETLNIFSQIGIIMLIGLVTKNGILLVEFANQRKEAGLSIVEAVLDGASQRFRPILMTSFSTVLGILPIALALGAGSESRVSMGIAVVGGLIISSLLTLYVVPAMYTFLSRNESNVKAVATKQEGEA